MARYLFDAEEFEKSLPHNMRFKQYDFVADDTIFWITQDEFDIADLEEFSRALGSYTYCDYAFVICRDYTSYDLRKDLKKTDKLYYVDTDGYIQQNFHEAYRGNYNEE